MQRTARPPKYRLHKARGCAVVTIDGRNRYLGPFGSPESHERYAREIAQWRAGEPLANAASAADAASGLLIAELCLSYLAHAEGYYRKPDDSPTNELHNIKQALRPLRQLYGSTPAASFGPLALQAVRQRMIDDGWCRTTINRAVARLKGCFKWAASQEKIPAPVFHGLQAVAGLRMGRSKARESEPVKPVPMPFVKAVLPLVTPTVGAMIQLQVLTGARPGEILAMRGRDLETSGKIWTYRPASHKNQWRGHERVIYLGPQAQAIVKPFLKTDLAAHLFCPRDAKEQHLAERRAGRKSPMTPSQARRRRKAKPRRRPGECYTLQSYQSSIRKACLKADRLAHEQGTAIPAEQVVVPTWHPHQLRHTRATELRKQYGIEVARIILGHKSAAITEVYAEADHERAVEVMGKIG